MEWNYKFLYKTGKFKEMSCPLGSASTKALQDTDSVSCAVPSKSLRILGNSEVTGMPTVLKITGFRAVHKVRGVSCQKLIFCLLLSRIPGYRVGCYYCLFQKEDLLPETATLDPEQNPSEYVVCFLGGSEKGLELYPFFGLWGRQGGRSGKASGGIILTTCTKFLYS